jgi:type VI secretion system secreted protein VgrG
MPYAGSGPSSWKPTISSWEPGQLLAPGAEQTSSLEAGEPPSLAVYDGGG